MAKKRRKPMKQCPNCGASVHAACRTCTKCGHTFFASRAGKTAVAGSDFVRSLEEERKALQAKLHGIEALIKQYKG